MEKPLYFAVLSFVLATGCAEGDQPFYGKADAAKDGETGSINPGDGGGGDDTGGSVDDTGGMCTVASAAGSTCGLFPQCGCSSGENCDVKTTDGKTECVPAGSVGVNEKCSGFGECQKGTSCIGSVCRPFCNSDSDCTSPGPGKCRTAQYLPSGSSTPVDVPGLDTCFTACDVLNPSSTCGSGNCAFLDDGTTACTAAGTATSKASCSDTDPNACAPGYVCISTGDCFKWCRVGFSSDCSGTSGTCTGFSTPVTGADGTEYGVCAY